jgi:hypothetical protein
MKFSKKVLYVILVVCIILVSVGVRFYAAEALDIDYDEPVYLKAAIEYAGYMRTGNFKMLAWSETNFEHPPLYKILYGIVILPEPQLDKLSKADFMIMTPMRDAPAIEYGMAGRYLSIFFGTIAIAILSIINPIAGFLLSINTFSVKFTSQLYLEALPMLTSFLAVLCYLGFYFSSQLQPANRRKKFIFLILSAVFLGVTAASKLLYCAAGLAIIVHALISLLKKQLSRNDFLLLFGWGILSLFVFFAFNPYLWPHPYTRLIKTLTFHMNYYTNQAVANAAYPFWQPIRWLFNPLSFFDPRPRSAFLFQIDPLIFIFAVVGLYRSYRRQLMYFVWFMVSLLVLLLWSTKWPQYVLILLIPYSMLAAQGVLTLYETGRALLTKGPLNSPHSLAKS